MANEITQNQRYKMLFRRSLVKDKLLDIERLVTGRAESYLPLISDKDGCVSKEKTELFIAEMLGSLRRYIGQVKGRTLSEDTVKMYESFLYCALMSLNFKRSLRAGEVLEWNIPSLFEDIIRLAENADIKDCGSYNSYLRNCYHTHRSSLEREPSKLEKIIRINRHAPVCSANDSDFLIGVKESLNALGYPRFVDCLPEKTLERLSLGYEQKDISISDNNEKMEPAEVPVLKESKRDYTGYFEATESNYEEDVFDGDDRDEDPYEDQPGQDFDEDFLSKEDLFYSDPDAFAEYCERGERRREIEETLPSLKKDQAYEDDPTLRYIPREEIIDFEQSNSMDKLDAIIPEWKQSTVFDKGTLCENFYRFVWLYFDSPDRKYFVEDIENMIDTYLYEHDVSAFSMGDDFAMVNYFIDQMKIRIEREIRRGKRK